MIIRTEMEIMRGTCIGQTRRGVHYIVFESEGNSGRIAIVGDANNGIWQTVIQGLIVFAMFFRLIIYLCQDNLFCPFQDNSICLLSFEIIQALYWCLYIEIYLI